MVSMIACTALPPLVPGRHGNSWCDVTREQHPGSDRRRPIRGYRRYVLPLASILVGLSLLAGVECLLRLFDLGRPTEHEDPLAGFSRTHRLFELDRKAGEYHTVRSRLSFFGAQRFAADKRENCFRAFCLGGSTVLGHPYQPDTAFPRWLELELRGIDASRRWEIVNCGGVSYASYRLLPILQEVLGYHPDLIIVLTGHNEFLEDRTYRPIKERSAARVWIEDRVNSLYLTTVLRSWLGSSSVESRGNREGTVLEKEVDARLDHRSGYASYHRDRAWREAVVRDFRGHLTAMVKLCQQAGVPVILVNPGSNLSDCPPFKSEHREGLSRGELNAWTELFHAAEAAESEDPAEALTLYRKAEAVDGEHGQLVYRIARCLERLARYEEARKTYVHAKELDVCPLRILEVMNEAVLDVGKETQTPVFDVAALFERRSPQRLVGSNWYVDHVHPSIRGNQLIAQSLVAKLTEVGRLSTTTVLTSQARRKMHRQHLASLGSRYLAGGRIRIKWLEDWGRRRLAGADTDPDDPRGVLDRGHVQLELGEESAALASYRKAVKAAPSLRGSLLDHALELFRAGRPSAATSVVELLDEEVEDPPFSRQVAWARIVLELDGGHQARALELYRELQANRQDRGRESSSWLREMPDVIGQLER